MSDDELSLLERAWAVLTAPSAGTFSSFPLDVSFRDARCRVAVDDAGIRHVLIPIGREMIEPDMQSSVLGLDVRRLTFGDGDTRYVDLSCGERDLFKEFDDVVADVLETAQAAERPGAAVVRSVNRWRRLFRSQMHRGLAAQARLGLFAELTVLSTLLDVQPQLSVDIWRGPLRAPHDFEAPSTCIEVKAVGPETEQVRIHGLHQLDTHDGRPLDLVLLTVVPDDEGITITQLVSQLKQRVDSPADLDVRLAAAGWPEPPECHDSETFVVGAVRGIPVHADVPRIVPQSFASGAPSDGVDALRYSVTLASLLPFATQTSLADVAREAGR